MELQNMSLLSDFFATLTETTVVFEFNVLQK